jgi:hypothetical protein
VEGRASKAPKKGTERGMRFFWFAGLCVVSCLSVSKAMAQETNLLELSRSSGVKLISQSGNSSGSGFFIDDQTASHGSVQIMGVDPLQATKAIIQTLDEYISTGIGYARSISFVREYINKNPQLMK